MPLPLAAILGLAGASALGGVASSAIAAGANSRAAQETNEEARRQFEENMNFQKYQYEDMKRYNSFENQRKMMQYAGLNPSLMFGSGAGTVGASSVGGVAPTASRSTPDYSFLPSALGNLSKSFGDIALVESQSKNLNANTENVNLRNITQLNRDLADVNEKLSSSKLSDSQRSFYESQRDVLQKQLNYLDERWSWENQNERFKAAGQALDNTLKELEITLRPLMADEEIKQLGALAFMNYKQGVAAGESVNEIKARTAKQWNDYFISSPDAEISKTKAKMYRNDRKSKVIGFGLDMIFKALGAVAPYAK